MSMHLLCKKLWFGFCVSAVMEKSQNAVLTRTAL